MLPPQRPARVVDEGKVKPLKAPSDDVPGGLTSLGDFIWVAQGELFQIEMKTGRVAAKYQLPASVGDLCTDGKQLFALTYGWTAGKPIYVIDPTNGKVVREIITESNKKNRSHGAKGIAWHNGHLHVLSGMVGRVYEIDIDSGEVLGETQLDGNWLSGLDVHRGNWITGGRTHLWQFDSKTGKVLRKVTANYPLRNVGTHNGDVLMMEQPIFGFGRNHERIQVWPKETLIYQWNDDK
jgi:outer membrane protein assembly factor BamB